MFTSSTRTTTTVAELAIRKTKPNPTNRRIVLRSVVNRDSNCPEGQRSWKLTGSRCTCANRSRRMSVSRLVAALDMA
jgi:hypothetical protein